MAHSSEHIERKVSNEMLQIAPLPAPLQYTNPVQFTGDVLAMANGRMLRSQLRNAIDAGEVEGVKKILETNNIGINAMVGGRTTLLAQAAYSNQINVVKFLLNEPGIDISTTDSSGETALSYALKPYKNFENANYEIACNLIRAGANINQKLITAWEKHNSEAADENIERKAFNEIFQKGVAACQLKRLPASLKYTHSIQFTGDVFTMANGVMLGFQLRNAIDSGDVEGVKKILETNNIGINAMVGSETTLLTQATHSNQTSVVKFLLNEPGIDVLTADTIGETALSYALKTSKNFKKANYEIARDLVKAGADINQQLIAAWRQQNQVAANQLVNLLGASIRQSEAMCNSNPSLYSINFHPQIALSKQHLREYVQGHLSNVKCVGIECARLRHGQDTGFMGLVTFLFERKSLAEKAFTVGYDIMRKRLSTQLPQRLSKPKRASASIPPALLFRENFEHLPKPVVDEIAWQQWSTKYNVDFPNRERQGYGPGAMIPYKP